jgi:cholesterol transport system auxiliary component
VGVLSNFAICGCVILGLLNGCVSLEQGYPEKRYFMIDVSRGGEVCPAVADGGLKIGTFPASPQYEGRGFVYYKGGSMYESDFYNEFFISPGAMLTEEVRQWVAASGLFRHVADLSSFREPTYFLGGRITALYGDYSEASAPKAVLEAEFLLTRDISAEADKLLQHRYRREVLLDGSAPRALVAGWNEALRQILTDLERDLHNGLKSN